MTAGPNIPGEGRGGGRLIVRHCGNAHPHICRYLVATHGYSDLCRFPRDPGTKSKAAHVRNAVGDLWYAVRNLSRIRGASDVVAIGPAAVGIALLLKVGLLPRCRRVTWFGLFIHDPRWMRRLGPVFRLLDSGRMRYVLFSGFEKRLYGRALGLDEARLLPLPYGDMGGTGEPVAAPALPLPIPSRPFFFSGGYSNRDYPALIEVFRRFGGDLVIAASSLNTGIVASRLPEHVTVVRDVSPAAFDAYAQASLACIIPIAHDTGAAGQSCLLRFMRLGKPIIATDTGIIREYIQDGVSGLLVRDNHEALEAAVRAVARAGVEVGRYGVAARERYDRWFSREAMARALDAFVSGGGA